MAAPAGSFPRRFGAYVLLEPLARGGMGALYLAVSGDRGMEKLCVIKTVLPHLVSGEYLQRFRDEAKVVVKLSHGNLVGVFDAGQAGSEVYIALDFVEGHDLVAIWNRCAAKEVAFPVDVAVYIVKELGRGLHYAHGFSGLKLVHRDVSPGNVMLTYSGEVKLTDFGLATSTLKLEKTAPGIIYGKVGYMSPEQARHQPLDGRTDVYAAGVILWELLTGRQLFPTKPPGGDGRPLSPFEALDRVRNPSIDPPSRLTSRVPPDLDRICLRALAVEADARYQTGEQLRLDLAEWLARTSPGTDAERASKFMHQLFGEDLPGERKHREDLIAAAADLLSGPVVEPERHAPSPDPQDFRIGTLLGGRYRLQRLVGEGGMGRVYEAEHVEIRKRVAVKIVQGDAMVTPDLVERFRREARAASKIGHPNIVDVTDFGTTPDGSFYIVMEYLEGVTLESLVRRQGPLPIERALSIAVQVCRAVGAAHKVEVIHRDLKTANVMVMTRQGAGAEDFIKVLDFGIAKTVTAEGDGQATLEPGLTRPGMLVGSPKYMAPEQAAGQAATPRTDVYAIGELLYEMLSGRPPFDGDNIIEILNKKARQRPAGLRELRPDTPVDLADVVERAMAPGPEDRHHGVGMLEADVQRCLQAVRSEPRDATPPPSGATAKPGSGPTDRTGTPLATSAGGSAPAQASLRGRWIAVGGVAIGIALATGAAFMGRQTVEASADDQGEPAQARDDFVPVIRAEIVEVLPRPTQAPTPEPMVAPRAGLPEALPAPSATLRPAAPAHPPPASGPPGAAKSIASAASLVEQGQDAFETGRFDVAAQRGREALRAGGGLAAHLLLGDAFLKLQRLDDARREFEAALAVAPDDQHARRGLELAAQP